MLKKSILPVLLLAASTSLLGQTPPVFLMDAARLVSVKTRLAAKDGATVRMVDGVRRQADKLLDMEPLSVMDKAFTPPSGSKHDYMSRSPYYWYDSTKPNGLPYILRDGQRNPEILIISDHKNMSALDNACRTLALAWYFTGEERYAAKAATLLRHWFIDDATRMNPNLNYAQAIPGKNDGRGIGIIESIALTGITDAAGLLAGSAAWTRTDQAALKQWYAQYLDWMLTSKNGQEEHAAKNNHGTWYLVQATDFALFTGDAAKAKTLAEEGRARMDGQIEPDGRMPLELKRTNALGYSTYNLSAWFNLATLADLVHTDLWNYHNTNGAGIRTAFEWLLPYALEEKPWPYQQIGSWKKASFASMLLRAYKGYKEPAWKEMAARLRKDDSSTVSDLLYEE